MRKLKFLSVLLVILFIGTISCTINKVVTPNTKLLYMYKIYNAQVSDYMSMAENPATTEGQKAIMRKKKPVLDTLRFLIPAFDSDLMSGKATPAQEQQIYDLLNSLN